MLRIWAINKDYEAFINLMKEAKERYSVKVFVYCLIPNHFHVVLVPDKDRGQTL